MSNQKRSGMLAIVVLLLIALGLYVGLGRGRSETPTVSDGTGFYYTGPIESKNHPGVWVMPDGRIVPPPAGKAISAKVPANTPPGGR